MKICLISPYERIAAYGLRILSSALKREGHEITFIFLPLDFRETIPTGAMKETVEKAAACELTGISLSSNYVRMVSNITKSIKNIRSDLPVVWGGIHPTLEPVECLDVCDISCIGEAEEAFCELAQRMENGEDITGIHNFYFKNSNGGIIKNPLRPLNRDLDSIPFPDFSCDNHWVLQDEHLVPLSSELTGKLLDGQYLTLSSRGCVHACSFCCNSFLSRLYQGDKWFRRRSVGNIVKECALVKKNLPWVQEILFDDDAFMARTVAELAQFSKDYSEQVGIPFFVTGITPLSLTEEKISTLIKGGMHQLRLGVQTTSNRINFDVYNRHIPFEKAKKALAIISRHHGELKRAHYDFIIDNPWETPEENLETLRFLLKIPRPWNINIYSLTFYPGTDLYNRAKKEGLLKDKYRQVYNKSYKAFSRGYLNRLFELFCISGLSPNLLGLFVNKWVLALRLNYPLWWAYVALRDAKYYWRKLKWKLLKK